MTGSRKIRVGVWAAAFLLAQGFAAAAAQDADGGGIQINADSMAVNQEDRTALFEGGVVARQGDMLTLETERLRIRYGETDGAGAAGGPGIERIEAFGGAYIRLGEDEIRSDAATYDLTAGIFEATGNVELLQNGSRVTGETFWADLATGESRVTGRVQLDLTSDSLSPAAEAGP